MKQHLGVGRRVAQVLAVVSAFTIAGGSETSAQTTEECLMCHGSLPLMMGDEYGPGVSPETYQNSVHSFLSCVMCHSQPGDYAAIPHFERYQPVECSNCHASSADSFDESFHGVALAHGTQNAPGCASCHGEQGNPHGIHELDLRSAEMACRQCHEREADRYDASVHFLAYQEGEASPACISCHATHTEALPPSVGAVNNLCEECHPGSMDLIWQGDHAQVEENLRGELSCASCHDVHGTHRPQIDTGPIQACRSCHDDYLEQFVGSVHEDLIFDSTMNCLSCHRSHQVTDAEEAEQFGCGQCHHEVEGEYRSSVHRLARLRGDDIAAICSDCHGGHQVLSAQDPDSPVVHGNIPDTCGGCHTNTTVFTTDYVRLPISLPNYQQSVHGVGLSNGRHTAVCTDCHGTHLLLSTSHPDSMTATQNISTTCGQCHDEESREFSNSVHGRAVAHGIADAPGCTGCHDEHLILATTDARSPVNPMNQASGVCANCHEDPEMAARYGLPRDVVESFLDSYHGWAIQRGGLAVAVCEDCHHRHDIRSRLDPESSIHPDNVVETCRRCHPNSNPQFAASYTHLHARDRRMVHDWVRIIYIWLIVLVLGGMALHNLVIYGHSLRKSYREKKRLRSVQRWNKSEISQHMVLLITFIILGLTGFALRFPNAWWVSLLSDLGLTEARRRFTHRLMAVMLVAASFFHLYYLIVTKHGRKHLRALQPRTHDVSDAVSNIGYHVGLRSNPPEFATYDYTQKAEYWALIWGTIIMSLSGFVLWFPEIATQWLPVWIVRVAEVVHYYEAILAVSAIVIWHFFFVIILPREYPMSWIWITGRQPKDDWDHHHGLAKERDGVDLEVIDGDDDE